MKSWGKAFREMEARAPDLGGEKVKGAMTDLIRQRDSVICAALGMSQEEVISVAKGRLTCVIDGNLETFLFDGRPLVTFWPIEASTDFNADPCKLVSSIKYTIHNHSPQT